MFYVCTIGPFGRGCGCGVHWAGLSGPAMRQSRDLDIARRPTLALAKSAKKDEFVDKSRQRHLGFGSCSSKYLTRDLVEDACIPSHIAVSKPAPEPAVAGDVFSSCWRTCSCPLPSESPGAPCGPCLTVDTELCLHVLSSTTRSRAAPSRATGLQALVRDLTVQPRDPACHDSPVSVPCPMDRGATSARPQTAGTRVHTYAHATLHDRVHVACPAVPRGR